MSTPIDVLVVDDEPGMRMTLKGILSKKGYKVSLAENGTQALEAVQHQSFNIILMDIKMPGMSGVDTFLKIKELDGNVPVIMMTGYAVDDDIRTALRQGAYAVLSKPLNVKHVLEIIDESLEHKTLVMVLQHPVDNAQELHDSFEKKGYKVVDVETPEDVLKETKDRKFQVIIMDGTKSPQKNIDLLKRLRDFRPDVSVIMTTSEPDKMVEQACQDGSLAVIQKPIDIELLLNKVTECLHEENIN